MQICGIQIIESEYMNSLKNQYELWLADMHHILSVWLLEIVHGYLFILLFSFQTIHHET